MDPYLDRIEEKGRAKGENQLASLLQTLYSLGRDNDAKKAIYDEAFRKERYKEFDLA